MSIWSKLKGLIGGDDAKPSTPDPPTPEALFSAEVESILAEHPGVERVSRVEGDFALSVQHDGEEHTLFLGNVFRETRELAPDERRASVERFCLALIKPAEVAAPWEEARERLVPLIRGATLYASAVGGKVEQIKRPFVAMLAETVGLDSEHSTLFVTADMVAEWGVSEDDVFAAARETMASIVTEVEIYDAEAAYALWHVTSNDAYEPSRLLLPGWLASFSDKVKGRPMAVIPDRATLIIGGDGDEACVRRMIDLARRQFESSPRSISPVPYTVDDSGNVVPLTLPDEHPLSRDLAYCHLLLASIEYQNQKEYLEQSLEEDIFVASFTGFGVDNGPWSSRSVWTKTVPTLLPVTGEVYLLEDPEADAMTFLRVPWAALAGLDPPCIVPEPDLDPPRFRTAQWPSAVQLEALRAVALPTGA